MGRVPAVLREFLNPLFLQALFGVDFHPWLRGRLEGIRVSDMRRLLRPHHLLRAGCSPTSWRTT
ncbi:MAG: hypothetical protein M3O70_28515 [Actinomycetota bacterium]|nr:hypothetical protein [Actinomycetota bacterium]